MLTREQALTHYIDGQAIPDRLTRKKHAHYVDYAARMLRIYAGGIGWPRRDLHRQVTGLFADEADCPPQRVGAFCKMLDDSGEYDEDSRGRAAELRLKVFTFAAQYHPLVTRAEGIFEHTEEEIKRRLADEMKMSWEQIDRGLYADLIEFQTLQAFTGYPSPEAFLSAYNVAQIQACLYRATRMTLYLTADLKRMVKRIRLLGLLHEIQRVDFGPAGQGKAAYRIDLTGPVSLLHVTRRYGVEMAKLIPDLLACEGWQMQATIMTPWKWPAALKLTHEDGLNSHLPPSEPFDYGVEEAFAKAWGQEIREGWRLLREAVILQQGQTVFIPDFVLQREDGREVCLEIVGFWTPEYLEKKRQTLQKFRDQRILLAVAEGCLREGATIPAGVITFKTAIKVEAVLDQLRKIFGS